jgi:geranylgeranyl pyrophosphate synthase
MLVDTSAIGLSLLRDNDGIIEQLERTMLDLVCAKASQAINTPLSEAAQAATYHLNSGGQRMRARLALSAGLALGMSKDDALNIACVAELLHNASLVHDDLQDRDALRHGKPTVWTKFGANVAICTGDLVLSAAYAALCAMSDQRVIPSLLALVHHRVACAIGGQCADLDSANAPLNNWASYQQVAMAKSGALLGLPLEMAMVASGHSQWSSAARSAAEAFSIGYQVVDDLNDVHHDGETRGLNIVFVLQAAGHGVEARAAAHQLGIQYLDQAMAQANKLPCESGALLLQLSLKLCSLLKSGND